MPGTSHTEADYGVILVSPRGIRLMSFPFEVMLRMTPRNFKRSQIWKAVNNTNNCPAKRDETITEDESLLRYSAV
jgi:hypothetical protein